MGCQPILIGFMNLNNVNRTKKWKRLHQSTAIISPVNNSQTLRLLRLARSAIKSQYYFNNFSNISHQL